MRLLVAALLACGIACTEPDGISASYTARSLNGESIPGMINGIYLCSAVLNLHRDGVSAFNRQEGTGPLSCNTGLSQLGTWSRSGDMVILQGYGWGTETDGILTLASSTQTWVLERTR